MGISIMGERIREIGGSLHIQSEVGGGTEVIARWQQPIGEDS
jgi:signal transduction histidine kinase